MIVEIYERATGKVVETKEVGTNVRSFLVYWAHQCNQEDYGWRVVKTAPAAKPGRTRKPTKARARKEKRRGQG